MKNRKSPTHITLRIVVAYGILAGLWIALSDHALMLMFDAPVVLTRMQTYKGWFFVTATSVLLFVVLYVQIRSLHSEADRRQMAQQEALEWSSRLQHYLRVSPIITYALNVQQGVFSPAWISANIEHVLGYTPEEALEPGWWFNHIHPADRRAILENQAQLTQVGKLSQEYRFAHKDGSYVWIGDEIRLSHPVENGESEAIGTWTDITKRKEAEQALQETLVSLEDQVRQAVERSRQQDSIIFEQIRRQSLNNLLINIAHQWRQPLNIIGLTIQEMADQVPEENPQKSLIANSVQETMNHLKTLSNTISKFSNLYQASNRPPKRVAIAQIFQQACDYLESKPYFSQTTIERNIAPHLHVLAVEIEIIEIFMELLNNSMAIATERKRESLHVNVQAMAGDGKGFARIVFTDDAGGIESTMLDTMFEPYTTSYFKSNDKGLGLYIIQRIITERYHGSIRVENTAKGASFTLTLPLA